MKAIELFNEEVMDEGDVELLLEHAEPRSKICNVKAPELDSLNWGKVQEIMQSYSEGDVVAAMVELTGLDQAKLLGTEHKEFIYFWRFLHKQVQSIRDREEMLVPETNHDLVEAGIEDMGKFGFINSLDALADGDVTKWDTIYNMPYKDIYIKQLKDKEMNEVEQNYNAIITRRAKTKG